MKNRSLKPTIIRLSCQILTILLVTVGLYTPVTVINAAENPAAPQTANDQIIPPCLQEAIDIQIRNLTFAMLRNPANSDINRNNRMRISRYTLENDLRPDLKLSLPHFEITCKPRFEFRWRHWNEGADQGESRTSSDLFVYEWQARVSLFNKVGRNFPKQEVDGADYAKLIWAPDQNWTVSIITNLNEGRRDLFYDFKRTYAAKIDYLKDNGYFSLNLSRQSSGKTRLGGFCSWNVSDAGLLYAEGSVTRDELEALLGISYTAANGANFHLEYFYNGSGTRDPSLVFYLLSLDSTANRESLARKNYLFAQYYDHSLMDDWSILARGTYGLDDDSASWLVYGDYNVGDHTQLFASGNLYTGNGSSEFGALYDYTMMIGIEYSY